MITIISDTCPAWPEYGCNPLFTTHFRFQTHVQRGLNVVVILCLPLISDTCPARPECGCNPLFTREVTELDEDYCVISCNCVPMFTTPAPTPPDQRTGRSPHLL